MAVRWMTCVNRLLCLIITPFPLKITYSFIWWHQAAFTIQFFISYWADNFETSFFEHKRFCKKKKYTVQYCHYTVTAKIDWDYVSILVPHALPFVSFRQCVSASQDGKLIVWDTLSTNKVLDELVWLLTKTKMPCGKNNSLNTLNYCLGGGAVNGGAWTTSFAHYRLLNPLHHYHFFRGKRCPHYTEPDRRPWNQKYQIIVDSIAIKKTTK